MDDSLASLAQCPDVASVGSALRALCSDLGSVSRMDILTTTDRGRRQALCFVHLDSPEQERRLMARLGVGRLGNELLVIVDLVP